MTWIIGASTITGLGLMVSDIRVRFPNGSTADAIQKAFRVGPDVLLGFAGSVAIGFELVADLTKRLTTHATNTAWPPDEIASGWGPYAAEIFRNAPDYERDLQSHLLLVGCSPTLNFGETNWPAITVARLIAPEFRARFAPQPAVRHIGTGAQRHASGFRHWYRKGRHLSPMDHLGSMAGSALGLTAAQDIRGYPTGEFSEHLHIGTVRRGQSYVGTNNGGSFEKDGTHKRFIMPRVAQSYREFCDICRELRLDASGASC